MLAHRSHSATVPGNTIELAATVRMRAPMRWWVLLHGSIESPSSRTHVAYSLIGTKGYLCFQVGRIGATRGRSRRPWLARSAPVVRRWPGLACRGPGEQRQRRDRIVKDERGPALAGHGGSLVSQLRPGGRGDDLK